MDAVPVARFLNGDDEDEALLASTGIVTSRPEAVYSWLLSPIVSAFAGLEPPSPSHTIQSVGKRFVPACNRLCATVGPSLLCIS